VEKINRYQKIGFLFLIVYYLISGIIYNKYVLPQGDEPHYLIYANSLIKDFDIYLENNYLKENYINFYKYPGEFDRHTTMGPNNHQFSTHDIGYPLAIAIPFALMGRLGVSLFNIFLTIILFLSTFYLTKAITKSKQASFWLILLVFLGLPFAQYSYLTFIEILAGLLIVISIRGILDNKFPIPPTILCISFLPWMQSRFLLLSIYLFILLLLVRFISNKKSFNHLFFIPPLSLIAYSIFLKWTTGSFLPFLRYSSFGVNINSINQSSNLINLLFDRQYGLLVYAPIFIFSIMGLKIWHRNNKKSFLVIISILIVQLIPFVGFKYWFGGYNPPPSRYLVSVIPLLIIPIIFYINERGSKFLICLAGLMGIWSIAQYFTGVLNPSGHGFKYWDGDSYYNKLSLFKYIYALATILIIGMISYKNIVGKAILLFIKIIKYFLLIVIGISLALFSLEIGVRVFGNKPATSLKFYENPIFGSALVPNQKGLFVTETKEYSSKVEINSQGWPDVEHGFDKPEGVFRILILGDSFVENFQVPLEKRFFRQLQDKLGNKFEIIAIGRGNTGTAQQYLMLKEYGLKYKPDLVIQMFLTANDVKNNSPVLQNDPYLPYFEIDDGNNLKKLPQIKRSERYLSSLKEMLKGFETTKIILSFRQKYLEKKAVELSGGYPIDYHIYDSDYSSEYQKAWDMTKRLIIETKKITEESGSKYVLVTLANNEQVNTIVQEEILNKYPNMKNANPDFEKPDRIIKEFSESEKLTYWQMLPYFQNYTKDNPNTPTHFHYDGHWNETGTNLAVDFLYENLKNYLTIK
jgi:hypothetical protein